MICPTCSRPIPADRLACPDCTLEASRAAVFDYQLAPLRRIAAGEGSLTVRTVNGKRHIQQFGYSLTYCQLDVAPQARRTFLSYLVDDLNTLCPVCRSELKRAMEEACRVSAL